MKGIAIAFMLALLILPAAVSADGIKKVDRPQGIPSFLGYVPDRLIVVMKPEVGKLNPRLSAGATVHIGDAEFDAISDRFAVSSIKKQFVGSQAELARYHKIEFAAGTLEEALEAYRNQPMVERVEPIGIHALYATPSDFYYAYQWHLNQASDHDIDAPEAWDIEAGSDATVVAILDSGTRYYHPDLGGVNGSPSNPGASRGNMWINNAELNGSAGVDDDGNGYVDDWIGYDFIQSTTNCWSGEDCNTKDNDPRDFNGHGTHTSGIFGMITNDGYGMCGVAGGWGNGTQTVYGNGVRIMPLRMGYSYNYFGQEYGVVLMDAAAEAFYYAANNGAKIASCSWGSSNSGGIGAAATYFLNSGGLIFVAAGNDGSQTADYLNGRGDCISVSATNQNDNGASFTTYGTWVDICAPGVAIYSTYHDHYDPNTNYWAAIDGTSMACPMAAGVAALIWSRNPGWTASQVENQLYSSADNIDAYLSSQYIGKMGAGRINAYNAVNTGPAPPVANFSGSPTSGCVPLTVNFTDLSTGDISTWSWTFGDGGTSGQQNPSHQYTSAGTYTVSLTVTGPGGSDSETKTGYITVLAAPVANFSGSPTSGEVPLTVNFTDLSSGSPSSWNWDFGDTHSSTQQNPSHTYTEAGTFTVTLTATNSCGSDAEVKTNYITVTCTPPVADFSGSPTSGDAPLTVNFTDLSTGATSWLWDFGDTQTSTAQNPSHTYTSVGTYTVTLTATNSCGSDAEVKTNYITVTCTPPVANFNGSPTSGDAPLTVDFTDLSTGATSWSWDFGDMGTSTAQNPSHTYTDTGTYTVTLTATNSCGSDDEVKVDYITVSEPGGDYANLPYSTGFESGSFDQYWFTQSSNSEGRILITSANGPRGSYHMTMDDNYNGGLYAQNEAWLHLNLAGKSNVELAFWWKEFADETHTQDGVFFSDNGGSSFTKVYSLANGTSTYQEIVLDVDALASSAGLSLTGTFVIKFQQYDNYSITTDGMAFDDISVVSLEVPPVADFSGTPTSGVAPLTVNFTDLSTGEPTSWSWNFGDLGTSSAQNPSHTYTDPGTYTVSLTATNPYGSDTETKTNYITVNPPGAWTTITYDDFESGWGSYTDGGGDCYLYCGVTYAYQGSCAADIQDNSGTASSFYHTVGHNVSGYTEMEIEFYFVAISMDNSNEDFWLQYYNGSGWQTVATWAQGIDFLNGYFYNTVVTISSSQYNFPTNARLRFVCDASGNADDVYIDEIEWRGMSGTSGLAKNVSLIPDEFSLSQNYPNPFNPTTEIAFDLPAASHVTLEIYNVLGQRVTVLADGSYNAGQHTVTWDASNQASGIYFYRLTTPDYVATKKMLLLK